MADEKFYQHLEYLNEWKPRLDEKAINSRVLSFVQSELERRDRIKVLDCGTGTGRGLIRLIENGTLKNADVEAFDVEKNLITNMPHVFQKHTRENGWTYRTINHSNDTDFKFEIRDITRGIDIKVHGFSESVYELTRRNEALQGIDLVLGQAFIEHVNQGIAYPMLTTFLKDDGLVYFYMNCDGWFNYSPSEDRERDEKIVGLFNDLAMNNQEFKNNHGAVFGGEAFCGRNLPYRFREFGLEELAFGPSDWVVTPFRQDKEEMKFIDYTAGYIREVCSSDSAKEKRKRLGLNLTDVYSWYIEKLRAIGEGSIGFTCVQKDILGRKKRKD